MTKASEEEKKMFLARNKPPRITDSHTFSIEWLRCFALIAISALFGTGKLTKGCVFTDIDEWYYEPGASRSLLRGATDAIAEYIPNVTGERKLGVLDWLSPGQPFCEPYVAMKDTFIWETFGFPHTCSFIDFNPFKEIFAILLPLFTVPMIAFLILAQWRAKLTVMNKEAQPWLYTYYRITTPFCVFVIGICHLWFVNDPEKSYPDGYGFTGHYIPYALFQTAMVLVAIGQMNYYVATENIPFGLPVGIARAYVWAFAIIAFVYQCTVISILMGTPILDSAAGGLQGTWQRSLFQAMVFVFKVLILYCPIILSIHEARSGDTNTITFGNQ